MLRARSGDRHLVRKALLSCARLAGVPCGERGRMSCGEPCGGGGARSARDSWSPARPRSDHVTALPLARQQLGSTDLPRSFTCSGRGSMMPVDEAESLDEHWAVAVFEPADRRELLAFAEEVRRRVLSGAWDIDRDIPEQLLPLSSAYELAAREHLDLFGIGHPNTSASLEQRGERARILERGARRAFDLSLAIPLDDTDAPGALYHTLLLAALAARSEEHTSELQSPCKLVCRLLLEKKK